VLVVMMLIAAARVRAADRRGHREFRRPQLIALLVVVVAAAISGIAFSGSATAGARDVAGVTLPLRLGYKASAEQFGPRELLDFAVAAEHNGFDSVFVSDHFQPWRHSDGHAPFAFSWLAAVGERTKRVVLGHRSTRRPSATTPASCAGLRHPRLAPSGPDDLGVGTGEHLNEGALGIEWPDNKERFARMREAVRLIRQLWTEQSVTFDGEYYHTKNATIYDRPERADSDLRRSGGPQVAKYAGRAVTG
jgi:coenzyme F420-dependent glucose-6-phosphate dehydrogenase